MGPPKNIPEMLLPGGSLKVVFGGSNIHHQNVFAGPGLLSVLIWWSPKCLRCHGKILEGSEELLESLVVSAGVRILGRYINTVLKPRLSPVSLTWERGIPCRQQDRRQDSERVESEAEGKLRGHYLPTKEPYTERLLHLIFLPILSLDVIEQEFFHLLPGWIARMYFDLGMGCNFNWNSTKHVNSLQL